MHGGERERVGGGEGMGRVDDARRLLVRVMRR